MELLRGRIDIYLRQLDPLIPNEVYQVTHYVSPSLSSPIEHQSTVVPLPPAPSALAKPPIVQVYSRRRDTNDTCPTPVSSSSDPPLLDPYEYIDLPIALRKDSIFVPKTMKEDLSHPGWSNAMLEEIHALEENHTWDLVDIPEGKKSIGLSGSLPLKLILMVLWQDLREKQD
ncbi:hypothetical protein KY290_001248 [Solanum tuberosum]|uniref:Mitochondrial protein n=1 Tax=Solanum tuberosum TaxID=4113 RepID=A0ABQ7WNW3_SOLTU|nr:hypothetical protein KY290_001248 [Solanum tuberosum]